jgi:hypothetical protein
VKELFVHVSSSSVRFAGRAEYPKNVMRIVDMKYLPFAPVLMPSSCSVISIFSLYLLTLTLYHGLTLTLYHGVINTVEMLISEYKEINYGVP